MKKVIELNSIELSDILGIGDGHIKLIESSIPKLLRPEVISFLFKEIKMMLRRLHQSSMRCG